MNPQPSLLHLKEHAKMLLARYKVEHISVQREDASKFKNETCSRLAFYPKITGVLTYIVALHEIGHLATASRHGTLLNEATVWIWVKNIAVVWTPECDQLVAGCLGTYASRVELSDRVQKLIQQ